MSVPAAPVYLVDPSSDPVLVRIQGRASFQNSGSLKDFFAEMRRQGHVRYVIDFHGCTSMDSTFLGVLAGAALELRKTSNGGAAGSLVLCRVGERNLELVHNLGLHRLLVVDTGECDCAAVVNGAAGTALAPAPKLNELESARHVLAAHENLVHVDAANRTKFEDVLSFLKSRVEQG